MTTSAHGGFSDFDARYLGQTDTMVRVLLMPGAVAMMVPKNEELKREWENPELALGSMIGIRVKQSFAQAQQIFQQLGSSRSRGGGPILS